MQLMLTARAHGYDTNPIGGYDKEKIAEVFGMDKEIVSRFTCSGSFSKCAVNAAICLSFTSCGM
jgi:nitroreductase